MTGIVVDAALWTGIGYDRTPEQALRADAELERVAARRTVEPVSDYVRAVIHANTGLNSPLWAGGWGLLIPVIVLSFIVAMFNR